jgi:hypothetical protein
VGYGAVFNSFGDSATDTNSFGNNAASNQFGNGITTANEFGDSAAGNSFGNSANGNGFGLLANGNAFGNAAITNTFGSNCPNNVYASGRFSGPIRLTLARFSGSSSQTGQSGEARISGSGLYICTGTNSWGRVFLSSF